MKFLCHKAGNEGCKRGNLMAEHLENPWKESWYKNFSL